MQIKTIRIKSTHPPSQGDFVEINESDFDPAIHTLYEPESAESKHHRKPEKSK